MKPENWQQVKEIFYSALERAPGEREIFLAEACAADSDMRRDVEILLESYQSGYLEKPVLDKYNPPSETPQVKTGEQINHYKIIKKLGSGGMGEVYLADDTRLNRPVAIKFFQTNSAFSEQAERRLLREAQSAAVLNHPNICTIYEISASENRSFIVMEYVEGETLEARIRRDKPSISESLSLTLSIAEALSEAHAAGIVHRDIKPSNVIINSRGKVKVLDFSLAKKAFAETNGTGTGFLSESGLIAGTIAYMSPEQARGQKVDARSDIWSLGIVLYEMLTGKLPFSGDTKSDLIAAILRSEPEPIQTFSPNLSSEIEQIIRRTLEKNAADRYQTVKDFAGDLRRLRESLDFQEKPQSFPAPPELRSVQIPKGHSAEAANFEKLSDSTIAAITDENKIQASARHLKGEFKNRRVGVLLISIIVIVSGAAIWKLMSWKTTNPLSFTAASRANLQISTLFNTKRKPGGRISNINFSPDGNLLAFSLYGEGKSNIYIKQISSGEPIKITDGKWFDASPLWSPDGQRILFISNRNGQEGVWAVSYLGGSPVLLKAIDLPQGAGLKKWSKDGRTIYYEANGNLYTFNLEDAQTTLVTSPVRLNSYNYTISPNEEMIAYVTIENEKEKIWIQSLSGGEPRQITYTNNHNWNPVWFPDNQRLAYSSDQNGNFQIYVFELQSGEATQITFGDTDPEYLAVSPDGLKIAYISANDEANIYSYNLENKKESAQTTNTGLQLFPDISPGGKQAIFQTMRVTAKIFDSFIKIKTLDTEGEPLSVNNSGGMAKWSPDGKNLAFVRKSGKLLNLWKISVGGQNEKQLTTDGIYLAGFTTTPFDLMGTNFSWSSDGSLIAFCSQKSGHINLWTISGEGSGEQMLTQNTDDKLTLNSPLWSPQGSRIAYLATTVLQSSADKPLRRVCVNEAGKNTTVFETGLQIRLLNWSASDEEIFIAVKEGTDIILFELNAKSGAKPRQIVKLPGAYLHGIRLSPDESQIAFTARHDENDNIYLASADGGEIRKLTANLDATLYYSGLTWSPDGKTLYYSKQTGGLQISMITSPK